MSNILITKAFCSTAVGSAKFVLLTLCDAANQDSECWLGLDTLRVKTGLSRTAIKSAIAKLELDGHISVKRRYNKTNIYQIHPVESKVAKELLYDRPTLEQRETLLDQVFEEITQKKKSLANGEILMGRNPTHQNEELMGRNPTLQWAGIRPLTQMEPKVNQRKGNLTIPPFPLFLLKQVRKRQRSHSRNT
ncbi:helix-turn-helix domain-containing protein [Limnobacter sp.]|uniref:helix-turn-helix domain-containing protein n=1 Tax=Limnobacter sp. TaxID=2003368 RepID=UPI0025BF3721|nr:helix-turn-helix domain-containing protein [Limnobacter sp.]